MKQSTIVSWFVRLLCLAGALFFAVGGPLPRVLLRLLRKASPAFAEQAGTLAARLMPSCSPLAALSAALGGRSFYLTLAWCVPPLVVLLLAVWRRRFFCQHVCPAGTCHAIASKFGARKTLLHPRLNGYLFWGILFGALAGLPVLAVFDPLATFNRALTPALLPHDAAAWIAGAVLPGFLLLGAIQPMIWCGKLCPLGHFFDLAHHLNPTHRTTSQEVDHIRREFLVGAAIGLPVALALRRFGQPRADSATAAFPILPPGAGDLARFSGACTRCYACVQQCPTKVIRVQTPRFGGLGAAFIPQLNMEKAACAAFCNSCIQACPIGALKPLPVEEKDRLQLGIAKINRAACLAWTDGKECMVCQEYCPYKAITESVTAKGLARPVVNEEICRGCGACQKDCPAKRQGKAIIVHGVPRQAPAKDAAA